MGQRRETRTLLAWKAEMSLLTSLCSCSKFVRSSSEACTAWGHARLEIRFACIVSFMYYCGCCRAPCLTHTRRSLHAKSVTRFSCSISAC